MGLFALVVALLIERLRPLRAGNPVHSAIARFAHAVRENFDAGERHHGAIGWFVVMAVSLAVVIVLEWIAASLHPVFVFALHVFVLYCTIGFQQFSEAFTEIRVAIAADDEDGARRLLKGWLQDCGVDGPAVRCSPDQVMATVAGRHQRRLSSPCGRKRHPTWLRR